MREQSLLASFPVSVFDILSSVVEFARLSWREGDFDESAFIKVEGEGHEGHSAARDIFAESLSFAVVDE